MTHSLDNVPDKTFAYHWFMQGFKASREGFNAEAFHEHLEPNINPHSTTTDLTEENRELLRALFENQWSTDE